MDLAELRTRVADRSIESVVVGFTDHYGRTMGKRFDAEFFVDSCADDGTHACDYLLTVDMEMEPVEGYAFANWERGYGDVHLVPDLATLREAAWTTGTAFVLCDVIDDATHEPVAVAPRSILKTQIEALAAEGFGAAVASELEFFLFRDSYREAYVKGYRDLEAAGWYVEDYHLLQASRVEDYVGAARRAMRDSEIPVENSKGEAAMSLLSSHVQIGTADTIRGKGRCVDHATHHSGTLSLYNAHRECTVHRWQNDSATIDDAVPSGRAAVLYQCTDRIFVTSPLGRAQASIDLQSLTMFAFYFA